MAWEGMVGEVCPEQAVKEQFKGVCTACPAPADHASRPSLVKSNSSASDTIKFLAG